MTNKIGTYSELMTLESYVERLKYLRTFGDNPGNEDRYLMNQFYKSDSWLYIRDRVIKRDLGCDLGVNNLFIDGTILVHHINPITMDDVIANSPLLFDMDNLITCSIQTHNQIHYDKTEADIWVDRKPDDTKLW